MVGNKSILQSTPTRILLGKEASDHLTATGESAFLIAGRASHPDDPSRWAIHLLPVSMKAACDAIAVAKGEARATRPKIKTTSTP